MEERRIKILKKAGAMTGIGLSTIALITGLSLGLKRSGNDIINADYKPKKLKPSTPVKKEQPRKDIEDIAKKTAGHGLIFIGNHIFLIIGGIMLYLGTRK